MKLRHALILAALLLGVGPPTGRAIVAVTALDPAPGSTVTSIPAAVTVTLSGAIDPASVSTATCRLFRAGTDGTLGTADDVPVLPAGLSLAGNQIIFNLAGVTLPNDLYRVELLGAGPAIPDLVSHWPLDEGAGATTADSSGFGNHGTISGPTWTTGRIGNALQFNGNFELVTIGAANLPAPWTAAMWVKRQDSPDVASSLLDSGEFSLRLEQYNQTNLLGVTQYGSFDAPFDYSAPVGSWVHVAFVGTADDTSLFINGVEVSWVPAAIQCPRGVLGNNGGNSLRGTLDDVRVFGRALSQAEILALASLGAVRDSAGDFLDGEFSGTLPSGNGAAGGTFTATFTLAVPYAKVVAVTPAPGATLTSSPAAVDLTLDRALDPASVSRGTCRLVRAGPDATLNTPDDIAVTPAAVTLTGGTQVSIDLTGVSLAPDLYRVTLSGSPASLSGLVAHWRLDEGLGTAAADSSSAVLNGVVTGPAWAAGRLGNALRFNGRRERVDTPGSAVSPPWTAAMWVKREDGLFEDARLMDSPGFSGGSLRLEEYNYTNQVGISQYTVGSWPLGYSAPVNSWVHLTFRGLASGTSLYADGVLVGSVPNAIAVPRGVLGSHGDHALKGTLDDVRVYDRALTLVEIQALAGLGGAARDLRGEPIDGEPGAFPSGNGAAGGDFTSTFTLSAPWLQTSPASLSFSAPQGGPNPASQTLTISNIGTAPLTWIASGGAGWLGLSPTTGALAAAALQDVTVSADVAGLSPGTYTSSISVSAPGAYGSPQVVPVTLIVTPVPLIGLSPASLAFSAPEGGPNPISQAVTVTNTGTGTLSWTAASAAPWVVLAQNSGSLSANASQNMNVSVNVSGLAGGTYNGVITVTAAGAANSPQDIPVVLTVNSSPVLAVSPLNATINAPVGGPNPGSQTLTVSNTGAGSFTWTAGESAAWLTVAPGTGTLGAGASQNAALAVDVTGLTAGTYTATITVDAPGASNAPQTVNITLNVNPTPVIGLSATSFTFSAPYGGPDPSSQPLTITNTGIGTMNWTATEPAVWLSLAPATGSLSGGASETTSLTVTVAGLVPGTYMTTISVSAPAASNTPQTVAVTLTVNPVPAIGLSPGALTFNAPQGGPNPALQNLAVSNTGTGTLSWTAADGAAWLSLSPGSGALPAGGSQNVQVLVDVGGLIPGTYTTIITVSATGASNTPQTCAVTLNVNSLQAIGLNPVSLTFNAPQSGPNPAAQTLVVSNTGSGTLNWNASSAAGWLSLAPSSGSLASGASQDVSVSGNVTGLSPGTYTTTITVSAAGASNSPQTVSVTLNVNPVPVIGLNSTAFSFSQPQGGPSPSAQTLTVSNSGTGTLGWTASSPAAWLGISPTSGSLSAGFSQNLSLTVNGTGLAAGTYTTTITVAAPGASNTPRVVDVTLTVVTIPVIALGSAAVAFEKTSGGPGPLPATVAVGNSGTGTLAWTASATAPWLGLSPSAGFVNAGATQGLTLSASPGSLPPGTYNALVTVSAAAAPNSPQMIQVTLTIRQARASKAGYCGLLGLEALFPLGLVALLRRRDRRP